jgi:hypothetical protein
MCGIWGIFPTDTKGFFLGDETAISEAMILTSLRGAHSTGIAMVGDPLMKPKVAKTIGGAAFLINTDAWAKIMDFTVKKANAVFGHGRYATKGAITTKNAHPFTHEHITLVHNGTINYGLKDEHDKLETEVDSHALCAAIAANGLVPTLDKIWGAFALIVHDSIEGCIYVVRNEDRPLHRMVFSDKHVILSEYEACKYFAARCGVKNANIEVFPKYLIFKYDIKTATWTTDDTLVKEKEKKFAPINQPWNNTGGSKIGGHNTGKWQDGTKGRVKESTFYCDLELLCTKIEPLHGSKQFKYFLNDDAGMEYQALSATHREDVLGELASIKKHVKMVDRTTGLVTRFVKFRELVWAHDPPANESVNLPAVIEDETDDKVYRTYNNYLLSKKQWMDYVKKEDCSICQGPILEAEAENTIITCNKTCICGDCIHKGRHYAFGFGQ